MNSICSRFTVAAVVAGFCLGVGAGPAVAHHWWMSQGGISHLAKGHAPTISFYNHATNGSWTAFEHARGEWSARSAAADVGNWASNSADVVAWDGYWGNTGWAGLATRVFVYPDGYHVSQFTVQLNISETEQIYNYQRLVACHELGHAIAGLDHDSLHGDQAHVGCMTATGYTFNPFDQLRFRVPSAHDVHHMDVLWGELH